MNIIITALILTVVPASSVQPAVDPPAVDPPAARVLESMLRAYRGAHRLEQETAYRQDGDTPGSGMMRSRLIVQKPNRLFLEIIQKSADRAAPLLSRFVCDGKNFYSYQEKNGWYAKEKAPKDFKDFDFLAMSVEMAAITGNDPVQGLVKQARSVKLGEPATIDGEMADLVVFDTGSAERFSELKLYINRQDHLLRRFAVETRFLPKAIPAKPEAAPLAPGETASAPDLPQTPSSFSYDVHVMTGREQTKNAFTWVAPDGSFPYQQYQPFLNGKGGKVHPATPDGVMPPGITPMKIISIQDLTKSAQKPNQKKKK